MPIISSKTFGADRLLHFAIFFLKTGDVDAAAEQQSEFFNLDRLAQKIVRAGADCFQRVRFFPLARNDDYLRGAVRCQDRRERGQSFFGIVWIRRQAEIQQDDRRGSRAKV